MRFFVLALTLILVMAPAALAQNSSTLRKLQTGDDNRGWEAVGRLEIGTRKFCTGALIAPDLVLTAAHCVYDKKKGRTYRADQMEFLAGWRNGRANARSSVKRVITHPKFAYDGSDRVVRVAYDVALVQLAKPIRKSSVTPFQTDVRPSKGDQVGVVSYAHDRAQSPSLQEACYVLARRSGTLMLSCDVDFGSSGAPIFTIDPEGTARIVSVISAKADVDGRTVALGTSLQKPLQDLMDLAAVDAVPVTTTTAKVRVLDIEAGRRGGGAKFVRP